MARRRAPTHYVNNKTAEGSNGGGLAQKDRKARRELFRAAYACGKSVMMGLRRRAPVIVAVAAFASLLTAEATGGDGAAGGRRRRPFFRPRADSRQIMMDILMARNSAGSVGAILGAACGWRTVFRFSQLGSI